MNKKLCTILHLIYHGIFGSTMYVAGSGYLDELKAIRTEVKTQSDRINDQVAKLKNGVDRASKSFDKLKKVGKKIENACRI